MRFTTAAFVLTLAVIGLAGCAGDSARSVDYSQQRGISADIAATHDHGPTSAQPGLTSREEPIGVLPWEIGDRHQGE